MEEVSAAVQHLIDVLGYEKDPMWENYLSKLFQDITDLKEIGKVRDNLTTMVKKLIRDWPHHEVLALTDLKSLVDEDIITIRDGSTVEFKKPVKIDGMARKINEDNWNYQYNGILDVTKPVCFEKGVVVRRAIFDAPTYIREDARVEYSAVQYPEAGNFIGPRSTISNTPEFRGTFVGKGCYIHALNTGNMIVGSGAGIGRCHVQNHEITKSGSTIIDPKTREVITTEVDHIPTFIGRNVKVGYGSILTGGTIIGEGLVVDHGLNIDGLVFEHKGKMRYKSKHRVIEPQIF